MLSIDIFAAAVVANNFTLPYGLGYVNPEVKYGDLLTILTISISAIALWRTWKSDQKLRETEYVEKIKNAFGLTLAKLERKRKIMTLLFYEIRSPIMNIPDKENNFKEKNRDYMAKILSEKLSKAMRMTLHEQIEIASKDIYAYKSESKDLFMDVLSKLDEIDTLLQVTMFRLMQREILFGPSSIDKNIRSELNEIFSMIAYEYYDLTRGLIESFRKEIEKLIENDDAIMSKSINIQTYITNLTSESHKDAIKGLKMRSCEDYEQAIKFYCEAIKNNKDFSIRGYHSGLYLAFLEKGLNLKKDLLKSVALGIRDEDTQARKEEDARKAFSKAESIAKDFSALPGK